MADFDLHQQISHALTGLRREMADIGGAKSPEMKAAARVLRIEIKKQLSKRAPLVQGPRLAGAKGPPKGAPSTPGSPPYRQVLFRHGRILDSLLWKSVGIEIVGGVTRVGERDFVARLLELGVNATAALKSGKLRRRRGGVARRRIVIAARPFMMRAAEAAIPKMGDDFTLTLQKRIEGGGSGVVSE